MTKLISLLLYEEVFSIILSSTSKNENDNFNTQREYQIENEFCKIFWRKDCRSEI